MGNRKKKTHKKNSRSRKPTSNNEGKNPASTDANKPKPVLSPTKKEVDSYLPHNADSYAVLENSVLPESHIPSPDAAALPSSACQDACSKPKQKQSGKPTCSFKQVVLNLPESVPTSRDGEIVQSKGQQKMTTAACPKGGINGNKNHKRLPQESKFRPLTDYFPVRRSDRKTKISLLEESQKEVEKAILTGLEEGFEVKEFPGKGRGVVSRKSLKRGQFVLEYSGDLIDMEEAKKREIIYAKDESIGCYMYYFTFKNKQYCVDATQETGRLGRLVNHSKNGNLTTKPFSVQDTPHLILFAKKDIEAGEELLYDYGDRSKKSIESHPWLAT